MIKIENTEVSGWKPAIRGMRNPMNSWHLMDSDTCSNKLVNCEDYEYCQQTYCIGKNDHRLMIQLAKGGSVHAKYRRMIVVYADITAPLYWWKEFDTYKVGTVANSCSTMHKIHDKEFTRDDFSHEHLIADGLYLLDEIINVLNDCRDLYKNYEFALANGEFDPGIGSRKDIWWQMIQLLPSSYNQKRTIMLNYEVLVGMYRDRKNHKLDEWIAFCKWIESLPYSEIITLKGE